jgi:hypothetical protein
MANDVKWIKIVTDVFDDEKIMLLRKCNEHLAFLQGQGLSRRILKIRNHVEELDFLALSADLSYYSLISLLECIQV